MKNVFQSEDILFHVHTSLASLCVSNRGRQRTLRPENVSTLCCAFTSGHALCVYLGPTFRTSPILGLCHFYLGHWKEPPNLHVDSLHPDSPLSTLSDESKRVFENCSSDHITAQVKITQMAVCPQDKVHMS